MTKETIIAEELGMEYHSMTSDQLSVFHRCMDEYPKQQAIAYDEWKWGNRWHSLENGYWYQTLEHPSAMSDKTYNKYHRKTPQELYNQFIEQQSKDNEGNTSR